MGLLAASFLAKSSQETVVHDPRLTWNTMDIAQMSGGATEQSKTGHAFIKETMRRVDAVYGGEMSAHHYFRDFAYCDSGMIPWLLIAERLCQSGQTLSSLIDARIEAYPASGEINRTIAEPARVIRAIEESYGPSALSVSYVDGLSVEYAEWRFNLRMSNTEPVVRLNVESRADRPLMEAKTAELLSAMDRLNS